jgi:hypothetical protein
LIETTRVLANHSFQSSIEESGKSSKSSSSGFDMKDLVSKHEPKYAAGEK